MPSFSVDIRHSVMTLAFGFAVATAPLTSALAQDDLGNMGDADILAQAAAYEEDVNDPLESVNRAVFTFNEHVYDIVLRPVAKTYKDYMPETVRDGIGNVLNNISTPVTMANNILQGDFNEALANFAKMVINTTLGMGGINDVVGSLGDPVRREDFGQTMAVWGVGEGFYLVLPVLGPSNPRDGIGIYGVDPYFNPLSLYMDNIDVDEYAYTTIPVTAVDEFAGVVDELDQIKKTSVDYYAAIRSMYRQRRQALINNGDSVDLPPIPDVSLDFDIMSDGDGQAGLK